MLVVLGVGAGINGAQRAYILAANSLRSHYSVTGETPGSEGGMAVSHRSTDRGGGRGKRSSLGLTQILR